MYRKRYYKKRYYRRKPVPKDYKLATVKKVKNLVNRNVERKWIQAYTGSVPGTPGFITNLDEVGTFQQLNMIPQGVDAGQRIGYTIKHKYLNLRYLVSSGTQRVTNIRVIIFWMRQTSGGSIFVNANTLFQAPFTAGGTFVPIAPYNQQLKGNYEVIYDRTHTLQSAAAAVPPWTTNIPQAVGGNVTVVKNVKINLKGKVGEYNTTSNYTMNKGSLWIMAISDVNSTVTPSTAKSTFGATWTLDYTDA